MNSKAFRPAIKVITVILVSHWVWKIVSGIPVCPEVYLKWQQITYFLCVILSQWTDIVLRAFTGVQFLQIENCFYFPGGYSVHISPGCIALKPIYHFVVLMIFGRKAIPGLRLIFLLIGVAVLVNFNILRISFLCIIMAVNPSLWFFFHTYFFRFAFYVIILLLWILWEES
ncbi:MAG: hypothetical protein C0593_08950 [Marinilabiliales bacterium]|nr:MAG: hypothetical protein C0593_08950 [Marinilabiliales bacterium]